MANQFDTLPEKVRLKLLTVNALDQAFVHGHPDYALGVELKMGLLKWIFFSLYRSSVDSVNWGSFAISMVLNCR